jgi:hypothetical protein
MALAFIAGMIPFAAHAEKFTFANQSGTPGCYSIDFDKTDNLAYGKFYANKCNPPGAILYASGVLTKTGASPNKVWSFSFTGPENATTLYLLDLKAMTWIEYRVIGIQPIAVEGHGVLLNGVQTP